MHVSDVFIPVHHSEICSHTLTFPVLVFHRGRTDGETARGGESLTKIRVQQHNKKKGLSGKEGNIKGREKSQDQDLRVHFYNQLQAANWTRSGDRWMLFLVKLNSGTWGLRFICMR